jgi:TRAP-type C4-dicarboxylate transport system permease small subunit
MEKMIMFYEEKLTKYGIYLISAPLGLMTLIEVLNVLGRKFFIPFPCALESVESLLVICIYMGVSIVALEGGHVSVSLLTDRFPLSVQYALDALANLLGALTFGFLAFGAWKEAFKAVSILEMRIGVYRFPLWPFKLVFAFGMTMLLIQLIINAIKFMHKAMGHTNYAGMNKITPETVLQQM